MDYLPSGLGFPGGPDSKKSACNAGDPGLILGLGRSWRREWQPTPVLLPGESHGGRSLAGYSPQGHKEMDTTEQLGTHTPQANYLEHLKFVS